MTGMGDFGAMLDEAISEIRAHLQAIIDAPPELLAVARAQIEGDLTVLRARQSALEFLAAQVEQEAEPTAAEAIPKVRS